MIEITDFKLFFHNGTTMGMGIDVDKNPFVDADLALIREWLDDHMEGEYTIQMADEINKDDFAMWGLFNIDLEKNEDVTLFLLAWQLKEDFSNLWECWVYR